MLEVKSLTRVSSKMTSETRTFDIAKDALFSAHKNISPADKVDFYNKWAENYDNDAVILDSRAPSIAADIVSTYFISDRGAALVLDLACGTGLVAKQMKKHGFGHFVGLDGSKVMLELAKNTGLYEDVRQCMLGEDELPVQWGSFDVVLIVAALSIGNVPVCIAKNLCKAAKPGGLVCMTTRTNRDNAQYKVSLEQQLKLMEEEGLWSCVNVTEVKEWERAVEEHEEEYISGCVYLYRVSDVESCSSLL
ncbi:Methyltransferase-like protein 27 [Merluccius polli]|uniref:Methyltransferase-like protein 27 n=1 Tax=Merluccius polli TaxID=89951 RepID=A0AA47NZA0_MERPO|nr:Methyltransferase-like protein 27 [Merluccius polli]